MNVVLDTNALMMPFEFNINIDKEIERVLGSVPIYVPSCVIGELKKLSSKRWEAKAALKLSEKYKIVDVEKPGDLGVIEAARKLNGYVVTNDQELMRKMRNEGIKVLFMKQNHLVMLND